MMRAFWRDAGPPLPFVARALASYLGIDFGLGRGEPEQFYGDIAPPPGSLSIHELAAQIQPPCPGGDTFAASLEIARRMLAPEGSS